MLKKSNNESGYFLYIENAKEILEIDFLSTKKYISLNKKRQLKLVKELIEELKMVNITNKQAEGIGEFIYCLHPPLIFKMWNGMARNTCNLIKVHKFIEKLVIYMGVFSDHITELYKYTQEKDFFEKPENGYV